MKFTNLDDQVHILEPKTCNIWQILKEIAETQDQEEAFYVCNIGDIVNKYKIWRQKLPRVEPHYAVKCNDNMIVLETLTALGAGFDCASKTEINKVMSLGVDADRIIFANPAKPVSHIKHAASVGVSTMTFDNETELHKVKKLYPEARLVIRIVCEAADAQCPLGMKFGCDPNIEAPGLLDLARSLDLNVVGVSFHVGSGCREPAVFRRAICAARGVFEYAETLGYSFELLDIGGGYPGDTGTSIDKIASVINEALDDFFPDSSIQIIAEPGRFFVSSAYTLACNIHSVRDVMNKDSPSSQAHKMYYINDGVYGSFNCILYDHQVVTPQPLIDHPGTKHYSSSIWGPTCDGLDQVVENAYLPEMKVGDWIVFEDMGAYTLPVASQFNGFPIPKVHYVIDEDIWHVIKDSVTLTESSFQMARRPPPFEHQNNGVELFNHSELPLRIDLPMFGDNLNFIEISAME